MEELRENILSIQAATFSGTPVSTSRLSDTTAQKAIKLSSLALMESAKRIEAIEYVYNKLNEEQKKIIRLKYWEGNLTNQGIALEMNINLVTFYRWRNSIVKMVAARLGWEM
jgi:RinA family phage transcriptional activator